MWPLLCPRLKSPSEVLVLSPCWGPCSGVESLPRAFTISPQDYGPPPAFFGAVTKKLKDDPAIVPLPDSSMPTYAAVVRQALSSLLPPSPSTASLAVRAVSEPWAVNPAVNPLCWAEPWGAPAAGRATDLLASTFK